MWVYAPLRSAQNKRPLDVLRPREVCAERSERSNRYREITLNAQKSAEAIVAGSFFFFSSAKGQINRSLKYDLEGGMSRWVQKTEKAAHKEIARNAKGM